MARLNVNPTRMELSRLKKQIVTAKRGHKLLKDKNDELMKRFLEIIRENKALRAAVEEALAQAHKGFTIAKAVMPEESMGEAFLMPARTVSVSVDYKNIMSVDTPVFHFDTKGGDGSYPYSLLSTSAELDSAVTALSGAFEKLLLLAQKEKTAQLLAREIEKTRRRVNALEHVMIPQFEETIRYITMKLEENERGNITRLMKVKDTMVKQQIEAKQANR